MNGLLSDSLHAPIRVFGVLRVTKSFSAFQHCTGRIYEYVCPSYFFQDKSVREGGKRGWKEERQAPGGSMKREQSAKRNPALSVYFCLLVGWSLCCRRSEYLADLASFYFSVPEPRWPPCVPFILAARARSSTAACIGFTLVCSYSAIIFVLRNRLLLLSSSSSSSLFSLSSVSSSSVSSPLPSLISTSSSSSSSSPLSSAPSSLSSLLPPQSRLDATRMMLEHDNRNTPDNDEPRQQREQSRRARRLVRVKLLLLVHA